MHHDSNPIVLLLIFIFILFEIRYFLISRWNRRYMHPEVLQKVQAEDKKPLGVFEKCHLVLITSFLLFGALIFFDAEKIYLYLSGLFLLFMIYKTYSASTRLNRTDKEKIKKYLDSEVQ